MSAIFNWSGGKDSAMAYFFAKRKYNHHIISLLTSVNSQTGRVSMHGIRKELLLQQIKSINEKLTILELPEKTSMEIYEQKLFEIMTDFKNKGVKYSIFGDIFLEDLKKYRDKQLAKIGMEGIYPLWQRNTKDLLLEFIDLGFKTIITAVDAQKLDKNFCGRIIDRDFIKDLPAGVDPCGENGEFHTFVFDGPIFKNPIDFSKGEIIKKEYTVGSCSDFEDKNKTTKKEKYTFWFCDLIPKNNE